MYYFLFILGYCWWKIATHQTRVYFHLFEFWLIYKKLRITEWKNINLFFRHTKITKTISKNYNNLPKKTHQKLNFYSLHHFWEHQRTRQNSWTLSFQKTSTWEAEVWQVRYILFFIIISLWLCLSDLQLHNLPLPPFFWELQLRASIFRPLAPVHLHHHQCLDSGGVMSYPLNSRTL